MLIRSSFVCVCLLNSLMAGPLETARALKGTQFAGWTYGSKAADKQVDCVQFMSAVISEVLQRPLDVEERDAVNINHGWTAEEIQAKASAGVDPRLAGVKYALVDFMQLGTAIDAKEALPGDFIQYWKTGKEGKWFGHASIISSVQDGKARLFGSHKATNGIAESDFELKLAGKDRHVFVARLADSDLQKAHTRTDGAVFLPKALSRVEGGAVHWTFHSKRWGMYAIQLERSSKGKQNTMIEVSALNRSASWQLAENFPQTAALTVYFEKPGEYPITVKGTETNLDYSYLALRPAPEGNGRPIEEVDGKVVLNSSDAMVRGVNLRYEPNPKKRCLGFWSNPNDRAEWRFTVPEAGTYRVEIDQGCGKDHGGSTAYVAVGKQRLEFQVEDTGHFQNFKTRQLGTLTLARHGKHTLTVGGLKKANGAVMDVREIRLLRE